MANVPTVKRTLLLLACLFAGSGIGAASLNTEIRPGRPWLDSSGELINAHGFCILHHEGTYYWYGAHKIPGKTEEEKNEAGVRCYVSEDLLNWKNAGMVLDVFAPGMPPELRDAYILDRPKVIYQAAAKKFVLYFKLYPPKEQGGKTGKDFAYVGAATSATPTGPFEYHGRFLGGDSETGSGDFAIFQDEDGTAYHIAVRKPDKGRTDKPLVCGRLEADGWKPVGPYVVMEGVENATEAPALFRRGGKYYLLGSASTGWAPNPARMLVADRLTGPYRSLGNPCRGTNPHNRLGPEKTFGGQSTFVFPVPGGKDAWIAMFDINKPKDPVNSGYVWLPLEFDAEGKPVIEWRNSWVPELGS
jgi:beta-xylosidase